MNERPACYPALPSAVQVQAGAIGRPLPLDVLTSPVPSGRFDSPLDHRHVLCLHLGNPVPVSWRAGAHERAGVRLHGQFCVVPAGSSTRWTLSSSAHSLLLRLSPEMWGHAAESAGIANADLAPAIHLRDAQIERIGWAMQAEDHDDYPGGRLFSDSLAGALAARLLALQARADPSAATAGRALPAWRLRRVIDYIEAHIDRELGLAELATVAGYSVSHFKPLFRNATGLPVHRFVLERRVACARRHLQEGRLSREQVAAEAGFTHASHMLRWLRRLPDAAAAQAGAARP